MSDLRSLGQYGLVQIATITLEDGSNFRIKLTADDASSWEKVIYAFVINGEIVRIGSSKGKLQRRFREWERHVTSRLTDMEGSKSPTPREEADKWQTLLHDHRIGLVFARKATEVETPVGRFRAYMDEESVLINRHHPILNRDKNR